MKHKTHSVRYNFIMNFILTATNFIFPLITFPYVSRILLSEGTGKIAFVTSVMNYFLMVASLGIPTYGIRACAKVRENKKELSRVSQEIFLINSVTTVLCVGAYLLSVLLVPQFRAEKTLFFINAVNLVLNLFGMNWLYQALEQYDYITLRSIVFKIVSVGLMFLLVHQEGDYVVYGAISVFAAAGSNLLNFFRARKYISFRRQEGEYNFRRHFKPILTLFAQSLAVSIYTNLDTVMLGFMKGNHEVGLYNAAVKVKSILLSLVTSLGTVMLPRMSHYAQIGEEDKFRILACKGLNITSLMAFPLSVYFILFARPSLLFLAGEGFVGAVPSMQIITLAVIPIGLTGILGVQILTPLERERCVLYSVIAGAVTDFVLNCVFIPFFGAAGAAFATVIAEFVVLGFQMFYTRTLLRSIVRSLRILQYGLAAAIGSAVSIIAVQFIPTESPFPILCISALLFFSCYGIVLLALKEPLLWEFWNRFRALGKQKDKTGGEKQ